MVLREMEVVPMPFRMIYDAIKKSKLLEKIYENTGEMNRECKAIFERSFDCLESDRKEEACELSSEDRNINRYEIKIRNEVLGYLAINSAPDLGTSLTLTSVVIDYERIGDYCKNIAQLPLLYPTKLDDHEYMEIIGHMKTTILEQFDLTYNAFKESDPETAGKAMERFTGIKTLHDALVQKINKDKKIGTNKAITYASLAIYLRRVSAHLKNIATSVVKPFPELGFEKKDF